MKKDIILSGVGGQGILSIATVIGKAALKDGDWVRWSSLQAYAIRSFSSAVTLTLMMCVFRFRGVSLRFSRACAFVLFISAIFDLL